MREVLNKNDQLVLTHRTYTIKDVIGKGATCIVYDAYYLDELGLKHNVRIKECFPSKYTENKRNNKEIIWHNEEEHQKGIEAFNNTYKKQLFFQNNKLFTNSTGKITDTLCTANNTQYIVLDYFISDTFEHASNLTIHDIIKVGISLTKLVQKYHHQHYLLLDLKPDNFLVIQETNEMVYFIDFDSIKPVEALLEDPGSISFSIDWAAPELIQGRVDKIGYSTDLYAIGAIIYSKIFNKKVTQKERSMNYRFSFDSLQELHPKAMTYLQELFSHTLANNPSRRYQDCETLLEVLDKLEILTDPSALYLQSNYPVQDNYFVGRKEELNKMDKFFFEDKHVLYLSGYGGVGKTELAKYYCFNNNYGFDTIIWLDYKGNIKNLIMDDDTFDIYNTDAKSFRGKEDKLRLIKHLVDKYTLIVLDNYDSQDQELIDLLSLPCKMLITTRLQVKDLIDDQESQVLNVGVLSEEECFKVFKKYYDVDVMDEENDYIHKIIDYFERYSLIIPLIAKELRVSDTLPSEKYQEIIKYGIKNTSHTKINHSKDNRLSKETTYVHLKTVFNTAKLSDEAKRMLYILTLLGNISISKSEISFYSGLMDNVEEILEKDLLKSFSSDIVLKYKKHIQLETVNYLIETGWLEYDERLNMVTCHPIIRELIKNECVMPYSQLKFFSYYLKKIVYKLYYDYMDDEAFIIFNDDYIKHGNYMFYENSWNVWMTNSYKLLVREVLKNKILYGLEDVYFYSDLLKYTYPFADPELTDIAFNILNAAQSSYPDSSVIQELYIRLIALVYFAKERLYIMNDPPNKYFEDHQYLEYSKKLIYTGYQVVIKKEDPFLTYQYIEEIVYYFYLLDRCSVVQDINTQESIMMFCRLILEYMELYKTVVNDHTEIKEEYVHDLDKKRDVYNQNLIIVLDNYYKEIENPDSDPINTLTKHYADEEDEEIIKYDSSAYLDINNDDVKDIKKDFLHHVYDYCFDLLLSTKVRSRYKKEQLAIEDENKGLFFDENKRIHTCDQAYLQASYYLNQVVIADVGECCSPSVLINNYLGKKYYSVFKILFLYFDAFSEDEEYKKYDILSGNSNIFSFFYKNRLAEIFDYFGYPEVGTEVCRLLSVHYYNKDNFNKGGSQDEYFRIEEFYDSYLLYAEKSHDKKAYSNALKNKRFISGIQFDYSHEYYSECDIDTEKMWQEIKVLFEKVENATQDTRETIETTINADIYVPNKYKQLLISCLYEPITMFDQYGLFEESKSLHFLNYSDQVLSDAIKKLKNNLNMVEKIYAYSEICYQYILRGNDALYLKYCDLFAEQLRDLKDYHGKFDYLAMLALQRYLELHSSFINLIPSEERQITIINGYYKIAVVIDQYMGQRWKKFDYMMMKMSYTTIAGVYCIEALFNQSYGNEEEAQKYYDLLLELNDVYDYLDKTWIGENHIVNEFRDAHANDGRLEEVYTKEREIAYLSKTSQLIELWKDEEHTKEEYQQKYQEYFDECFPIDEEEEVDFIQMLMENQGQEVEELFKIKKENDEKGKRTFYKIGDEIIEI